MGYTKYDRIVCDDGEVIVVAMYFQDEDDEREYRRQVEESKKIASEKEGQ